MEVRLSSPALVKPGLSVEPLLCQTKFLSENWRVKKKYNWIMKTELTNLAFGTTAALIVKPNGIKFGPTLA